MIQNDTGEEEMLHYQCMYCDRIYLSEGILDWHMSTEHYITGNQTGSDNAKGRKSQNISFLSSVPPKTDQKVSQFLP